MRQDVLAVWSSIWLIGVALVLGGCEQLGPRVEPGPQPQPNPDLGAGRGSEVSPSTVGPCLDCLTRYIPPELPENPLRATLFFTYQIDDPDCRERIAEQLDNLPDPRIPLIPLPVDGLHVGLTLADGRVSWVPVDRLDASPIEERQGELRWQLELDDAVIATLGGSLDDVVDVELRGGCDADDDDCDGAADESIDGAPSLCGVGACVAAGALRCQDGETVIECTPGEPGFEMCDDGIDADCDGEDGGRCYDGALGTVAVGRCAAGTLVCDPLTGDAICDGQRTPLVEQTTMGDDQPVDERDEDCDGTVDEVSIGCVDCDPDFVSIRLDGLPPVTHRVIVEIEPPEMVPADPVERAADITARQAQIIGDITDAASEAGAQFTVLRRYVQSYGFVAEVDVSGASLLASHVDVESVTRDLTLRPALAEVDALIGAAQARRLGGTDGRGAAVAVVDTGIDYFHEAFGRCASPGDLLCAVRAGWDFLAREGDVDGAPDPYDPRPHGTDIAQIIVGRGADGAPGGLAPGSGLVALRVVDDDGNAWLSDVVAAFDYVLDHPEHGVRVVNVSLASDRAFGRADCAAYGTFVAEVAADLAADGVMIVAAAGNVVAEQAVSLVACIEPIVAVGATYAAPVAGLVERPGGCIDGADAPITTETIPCDSAGRAAHPPLLDITAPSVGLEVDRAGGPQPVGGGTSAGAAVVSAGAALMFGADPAATPAEVITRLKVAGVTLPGPSRARRLDLDAAMTRDCLDADGDGYGAVGADCVAPLDCRDDDPRRHPGAIERRNGVDDDCDDIADEGGGCETAAVREPALAPECAALDDTDAQAACLDGHRVEMEALHPGLCQRWSRIVEHDGIAWYHCVAFEPAWCPDSVAAFR